MKEDENGAFQKITALASKMAIIVESMVNSCNALASNRTTK
jgi:hypothetical protein